VAAVRVTRCDELGPALAEAFRFTRPMLVEVVIDGADELRPEDA
jgi:thiamine pyrophosphate-dependent acetolactate synthase large subunit-like protein